MIGLIGEQGGGSVSRPTGAHVNEGPSNPPNVDTLGTIPLPSQQRGDGESSILQEWAEETLARMGEGVGSAAPEPFTDPVATPEAAARRVTFA